MIIEVEAKFNTKDTAFHAFNKINKDLDCIEEIDLVTKKTIDSYVEQSRLGSLKRGLLKSSLIGCSSGVILAYIGYISFYFGLGGFDFFNDQAASFLITGLSVGLLTSTLLFFIFREHVKPISTEDIHNKEAIIVAKVDKKDFVKLKRLLLSYGVNTVQTI